MVVSVSCGVRNDKPDILAKYKGPGPVQYTLPPTVGFSRHDFTRLRNPAYSLGPRTPPLDCKQLSPGPIYTLKTNYTRNGSDGAPKFTMAPTTRKQPKPDITPGPGTYSPEKCPPKKMPPSFSLSERTKLLKGQVTPCPTTYHLPALVGPNVVNKPSAAAFTIYGRLKASKDIRSPGPATYYPGNPDTYKDRKPIYTMRPLNMPPCDKMTRPSPTAYTPGILQTPAPPKFSFGIKHSEFKRPLISLKD